MESSVDRVVVAFEGEGSGTGELAWGQQEAWMTVLRLRSWMPVGGIVPLSPETTVEDIAGELRYMVSRYQVLRTKLLLEDRNRPRQVVYASGEIALEVIDAGEADPDTTAKDVHRRYIDTDLDFAAEWPIRMGVVRRHGKLTHVVALISHFAADAHGARVLQREVPARVDTAVAGTQPLEQARWQQSPSGRRQNEAALRYFESILRAIEPRRYHECHDVEQTPVWTADFTSPAMRLAIAALVDRTGVDTDTLFLATFAIAMTQITGINPVVVRPLVGNRFRPGLADVVCSATQPGLCVLDVADVPFDEALPRVRRATMAAYKHAYHDPIDLVELQRRVSRDRGAEIDIACFFNNRRGEGKAVPEVTSQMIEEALPRSVLRWTPTESEPLRRMFGRVENDTADAMRLSLFLDTHLMSLADGEACLRGMQAVAIKAAQSALAAG
ncbi:MAG TPA: condensation domain-containing protein [Candidatus Limnocylindrales bacterium]|nr:condensation domain-containing protein [Candidatus Limnocylindrales bacterium]